MNTIVVQQENVAYLEACEDGERCPVCASSHDRFPALYTKNFYRSECDCVKGRIAKKARVTVAFPKEEQNPEPGCSEELCTAIHRKLPLPINATVEVRVVCEDCLGLGGGGNWCAGPVWKICTVCSGEKDIDTLLRIKTSEPPWVGEAFKLSQMYPDGVAGIWLPVFPEMNTMVASYECEVSKVEVSECQVTSQK